MDASHETEDVKKDIRMYWEILNSGGAMFGDDYISWISVKTAVDAMGEEMNVPVELCDNCFWKMKKV